MFETRDGGTRDGGRRGGDDDDDGNDDGDDGEDDGDGQGTRRDAGRDAGKGRLDAGDEPEGCGEANFRTQPLIPDMLIVLDRSGSMRTLPLPGSTGGAVDRWGPSVAAVKTLTRSFEQSIQFGLMTFPAEGATCGPGDIQVPIDLGNADSIAGVLDATQPSGGTPTGETLQRALSFFQSQQRGGDTAEVTRYVLLVTDGQPTCPTAGAVTNNPVLLAADKELTIKAIDALAAEDIKTYVVGYDAQLDPVFANALTQFAEHGGTGRYYPVQDEASLLRTFNDISKQVISCGFAFDKEVDDPVYLKVELDGKVLRLNGPDGFVFRDKTVTIQGAACQQLQESTAHRVEIKLACTPVVAI